MAVAFGCACIFLIIGVQAQKHLLMIPYLVVQPLVIALMAIVGMPIAAVLFYVGHPYYGISVSIVVFISSILPIFYWFVVKKAFTELRGGGTLQNREKDVECG